MVALRLRCSALAKVSLRSLVRARVKWLPPSGMGRCQMMRSPSVMTRLVLSAPMSRADDALLLGPGPPRRWPRRRPSLAEQVVGHEVAQGQRRHLHQMHLDADVLEVLQVAVDHVALHGEQADFGLDEAVGQLADADLLVVPDDLVEVERDLLLGLEADDVGDLLFLDRRQLDEAGQAALAGHADGDLVAAEVVARQELFQRLAGQLVGVGVGLAEDLGMLDVVEGGGGDFAVDQFQADGLEGALAEIDAPDAGRGRLAEVEEGAARLGRDAGFGLGLFSFLLPLTAASVWTAVFLGGLSSFSASVRASSSFSPTGAVSSSDSVRRRLLLGGGGGRFGALSGTARTGRLGGRRLGGGLFRGGLGGFIGRRFRPPSRPRPAGLRPVSRPVWRRPAWLDFSGDGLAGFCRRGVVAGLGLGFGGVLARGRPGKRRRRDAWPFKPPPAAPRPIGRDRRWIAAGPRGCRETVHDRKSLPYHGSERSVNRRADGFEAPRRRIRYNR